MISNQVQLSYRLFLDLCSYNMHTSSEMVKEWNYAFSSSSLWGVFALCQLRSGGPVAGGKGQEVSALTLPARRTGQVSLFLSGFVD